MTQPLAPGIKGNVLLARLEFVRGRGGEPAVSAVLGRLSRRDQDVLRGQILPIAWYPLELSLRLDEAIAAVLSPENRARVFVEMGRASADADLGGAQRHLLEEGDPHFLLSNAPRVFSASHTVGRSEYQRTGDTSAVIRTHDADGATAGGCLTAAGFYARGIERSGGKDVKVVETRCRTRGDPCCEWRCEWAM
ncbi:MAG TPA: TIGR02265 family protein [Anaeromyxobacteraceae bacterium]|nr:TIGR02265 family protein [Anaeromyxobacteraceae bacterium]